MIKPAHQNSFDLLRLIFAIIVLFTHSNPIVGLPDDDFLIRISNNTYSLSSISVPGFFTISGFLVIQSLRQTRTATVFLNKRAARIYPGLLVMLLLIFLLGWFVYSGSFSHYVHDPNIYTYPVKKLLMMKKDVIFGLFDGNPVPFFVNVSLWTIPYEVLFYVLLTIFFLIPKQRHLLAACIIYGVLFISVILTEHGISFPNTDFDSISTFHVSKQGSLFFGGVILGLVPEIIQKNRTVLFAVFGTIMLSLFFLPLPFYSLYLVLPVVVTSLGLFKMPEWIGAVLKKTGDISYGIYIYGFPVQQTLMYYFKLNYWQHAFLSVVVVSIIGYLSWNFVEKPALLFIRKRLPIQKKVQSDVVVAL